MFYVFDSDSNAIELYEGGADGFDTLDAALEAAAQLVTVHWPLWSGEPDYTEIARVGEERTGDVEATVVATVVRGPDGAAVVDRSPKRCVKCGKVLPEILLPGEDERCAQCGDAE